MKVGLVVVVALCASTAQSTAPEQSQLVPFHESVEENDVSNAAAAQLQRLSHFPRSGFEATPKQSPKQSSKPNKSRAHSSGGTKSNALDLQLRIPIDFGELLRIFTDGSTPRQDSGKKPAKLEFTPERLAALDKYADKIMQDESVQKYMRERIKRDNYGYGYGHVEAPVYGAAPEGSGSGGSASFVSGLASGLFGSVAALSQSSSKTPEKPAYEYGATTSYHAYGKEKFTPWDFKKAILSTLIQAAKAVGGGLLALNGQLIKGSGFLVSAKGRLISGAGEAITGLGKNLASSAIVQPAPPAYDHGGYAYGTPAVHTSGHDGYYEGPPPPSLDGYHTTYDAASNVVYAYAYYPGYSRYRRYIHIG